ncbi:PREDICTED: carbon catabolite repressor protein 4 homolog 4 isoform X1 [Theobroma cacao]|uniref:Carbon catabolite repressor protein 4 homolog 4 isoform X1 n=2 Tax=Theobroma cacao TaxID=3641 RepID=A0AB32W3A9_THECC|nr:PREDICTED: carbon catabolite repressor protein 4 homolog 4 isoform X1 [Theobroma cacao]
MGCLVNSCLSSLCWWAWAATIRGLKRQPASGSAHVDIHINYNMLVRFRTLTLTGRQRPPVPSITRCVRRRNCCSSSNMSVNMTTGGSSSKSAPIIREFVDVEGGDIRSRGQSDGIRFRLVSYNILAQAYVKSSLFPHSPSPSLRWKARSQAILTLLKNLGADFFCLQEVDEYDSFYKRNMADHGYSSIYVQRSGQKRDGCGIFYKNNCAELLGKETIEYNDLVDLLLDETSLSADKQNETLADGNNGAHAMNDSPVKSSPECRGDPNDPHVRLKRDCVGIMAAFRLKDPFHRVVILANTHLYWDPEWADVKLAQAKYLLSRLAQFKTLVTDKFECTPSLILSGDFNSTPGDKVYQYLISGNSSSASLMTCLEELPFPLCSVHAFTRGEPPFTNCTPDFTNTLDYIFFSPSDCLKPVSILELPELDSPDVVGGLPNYSHPSDHLPIGAEFEITKE